MSNLLSILIIAVSFYLGALFIFTTCMVACSIPKVRKRIIKWRVKMALDVVEESMRFAEEDSVKIDPDKDDILNEADA